MSLIPGNAYEKTIFPDGIQVDHISENSSGHGIIFNHEASFAGNVVIDPTLLSNAQATKLGHKHYLHGQTYYNGVGPTIVNQVGGSPTISGCFIPYQMQDGIWRLRGNLCVLGHTAVGPGTTHLCSITEITFHATLVTILSHDLDAGNAASVIRHYLAPATNYVYCGIASGTFTEITTSFDAPLASKPTWAY
jgi:hypothetical protein